jgi:hypothetical protein
VCDVDPVGNKLNADLIASNCWSHKFLFSSRLIQYFGLRLNFENVEDQGVRSESVVNLKVTWMGRRDASDKKEPWTLIASDTIQRTNVCEAGATVCNNIDVVRATSIEHVAYYFQIEFDPKMVPDQVAGPFPLVTFTFTNANWDWSLYQIILRSMFQIVSFTACLYYSLALNGTAKRHRSYEQRWVRFLLFALFVYNNPVYMLTYAAPRNILGWIDTLLQMLFLAILLLFWLVTFDGLTHEPPFHFKTFYLPKICFMGVYFLVGIGCYLGLAYDEYKNPLYDWASSSTPLMKFATAYVYIGGISYLIFLATIFVHAYRQGVTMTDRQKVMMTYHMFVFLTALAASIIGEVVTSSATNPGEFAFFYLFFNMYILSLAYLYYPTSNSVISHTSQNMQGVTVKEADYGGSILDEALEKDTTVLDIDGVEMSMTTIPLENVNTSILARAV